MTSLLAVFGCSLACCLALTPAVRFLARRYGLVDRPDGRRKLQTEAVPLGGGLAIFFSAVVGVAAAIGNPSLRAELLAQAPVLIGLGLASLVIAAVGLLDDVQNLRGIQKLAGQAAAVSIVIAFGVVVRSVHLMGVEINLGLLSVPLTAFFLLGAVNSLNLLDGMDGMLSCIGLIICLAVAIIAALLANWTAACVAAALAGALLGFLRYNCPPATIFMGDCGSMVVGLVIGVVAIEGSLKGPATVFLAAPLALLSLPILDTSAAVVRRKLSGRSLFVSDRGHLHHCLLGRGLSKSSALWCVSALSMLTLLGAVASVAWHAQWVALASIVAVFHILIATRLFGYAEFQLVKKRLAAKLFRSAAAGRPQHVEVRLQGTVDWSLLWRDLTAWAEDMDLESVSLDINAPALHESYFGRWDRESKKAERAEDHDLWRAQIPLTAAGQCVGRLETVGRPQNGSAGWQMAVLSHLLEKVEAALAATMTGSIAVAHAPITANVLDGFAGADATSVSSLSPASLAPVLTAQEEMAVAIELDDATRPAPAATLLRERGDDAAGDADEAHEVRKPR